MSADWKAGDLAVCVDAGTSPRLRKGAVHRVFEPIIGNPSTIERGQLLLRLWEFAHELSPSGQPLAWAADRFRKLNDGPEDAALIASIKACQPIKEPVTCA